MAPKARAAMPYGLVVIPVLLLGALAYMVSMYVSPFAVSVALIGGVVLGLLVSTLLIIWVVRKVAAEEPASADDVKTS